MGGIEEFSQLVGGSFTLSPDGNVGASNSAHEVFFGRMNGNHIAVKPHASERAAKHEGNMLRMVADLGFNALRPIHVIGDSRGVGAYLITERMNLISAASLPIAGPPERNRSSVSSITDISATLADLHAQGVSHGDAQVKNFGLLRTKDAHPPVVVYDLEKGGSEAQGHVKSQPFAHDMDSLAQSLAHKGFGGHDLDQATDALMKHVLTPYHSRAVSQGIEPAAATETINSAYGSFIDVQDRLRFAQSNGGHVHARPR